MSNFGPLNTRPLNTLPAAGGGGGGGGTTVSCTVGAATLAGLTAAIAAATVVSCSVGTATLAGQSATVSNSGGTTVSCSVGAGTLAGQSATVSVGSSHRLLLQSPFFQADVVPGPVTVLLRKWSSGSWVADGSAQTVTQLADPNVPNGYSINALYTPESDGSYQAIPIWSVCTNAWQPSHTYAANTCVSPVTANGHYFKVIAGGGGNSGSGEPLWPLTGGVVTDGAITWQDQGQALMMGDAVSLPPTPIGPGDTDWKIVLANANGVFDYNAGTHVLTLKDKSGTTTLATMTLTLDGSGNTTHRASS